MLSLASATSAQADELARSIALYRSARERFDGAGLRDAERSLRRLLRAGHHSSEAYFYLGTSLSAQGRHNEAADGYAATLRLDPASVSAWDNMAISLDEAGRLSEVRSEWQEAIRESRVASSESQVAGGGSLQQSAHRWLLACSTHRLLPLLHPLLHAGLCRARRIDRAQPTREQQPCLARQAAAADGRGEPPPFEPAPHSEAPSRRLSRVWSVRFHPPALSQGRVGAG